MKTTRRPNIVYLLADDMGYGDIGCNNPESRIPTPRLDELAAEGMRFTDAHSTSSVCTPSRYSILTGRYCWRSRLKSGIVWEWDGALIEPGCPTVAGMLKEQGYRTACFGKWHLGWDWPTRDGSHPNATLSFGTGGLHVERAAFEANIDYSGQLRGGPTDHGFETYFGVDVPNFPPYAWFEDDRIVGIPSIPKPSSMYGEEGLMVPGWTLERMIPEMTHRAVRWIEDHAEDSTPFFLYFALTAPHSPVVPNAQFKGKSGAGNYGDFVCEVDWVVGEVMEALHRSGQAENTLVVFTSDNGPEGRVLDDLGAYERARDFGHCSMGSLRGIKSDAWEGGHRVPFVARWPGRIPPGTRCDQLISLGDLMRTCADLLEIPVPEGGGEDSVSMLPLLLGATGLPVRNSVVHHSGNGKFAIRHGEWVFIDSPSGEERQEPDWWKESQGYLRHSHPGELFHLRNDLPERINRYGEETGRVEDMRSRLRAIQNGDAARQGADAPEHHISE